MKTLILAAFLITFGLASCTVTEPNDGYYSQQRVHNNGYAYDPYYSPINDSRYTIQRVYDQRTGRYYDVPVYNSPYGAPVYQDGYARQYRRDNYRRDNYRTDGYRREYRQQQQQPRYEQPQSQPSVQPQEKRLPDGTRISPDGTVTLPNGQVRNRKQ